MSKIVIRFERPFWDDSKALLEGFTLLSQTRGKFRQWFIPHPNIPLLMCLKPPDYSQVTESMTEEELCQEVLKTLAGAFSLTRRGMPKVVLFHRTKWGIDPYSLGTWSYLRCGASAEINMGTLAEPIASPTDKRNRVYFVGECTSVTDFSTAHGAYMSGLRAAKEIIRDHGG